MKVHISLFGALREAADGDTIELELPNGASITHVRTALTTYLTRHAPHVSTSLVQRSAFASDEEILHDHRVPPEDGRLALLPPVSGG